ncbi:MAG: hypothetical protein M1113_01485 [Candidatus Thermoplasmatota archaeon]|nr:hypothetical protein [Candidatus Thermoplasmatota archaeon]
MKQTTIKRNGYRIRYNNRNKWKNYRRANIVINPLMTYLKKNYHQMSNLRRDIHKSTQRNPMERVTSQKEN